MPTRSGSVTGKPFSGQEDLRILGPAGVQTPSPLGSAADPFRQRALQYRPRAASPVRPQEGAEPPAHAGSGPSGVGRLEVGLGPALGARLRRPGPTRVTEAVGPASPMRSRVGRDRRGPPTRSARRRRRASAGATPTMGSMEPRSSYPRLPDATRWSSGPWGRSGSGLERRRAGLRSVSPIDNAGRPEGRRRSASHSCGGPPGRGEVRHKPATAGGGRRGDSLTSSQHPGRTKLPAIQDVSGYLAAGRGRDPGGACEGAGKVGRRFPRTAPPVSLADAPRAVAYRPSGGRVHGSQGDRRGAPAAGTAPVGGHRASHVGREPREGP